MTISGMTGFARAEGEHAGVRWVWEAKSVNGRALDLKCRLPSGFDAIEPFAREAAAKRFKRGSIQAGLTLARDAAETGVRVDTGLVERLIAAGAPFIKSGAATAPSWDGLLGVRGVLIAEDAEPDEEARKALQSALLRGLEQALDGLNEARQGEGRMLAATLGSLMDRVDALVKSARASAAAAPAAALERIRQKLAALAPEIQADPLRMAQEAAIAATRADVAEELERLSAHAGEVRALIAGSEPAGRRLDFLAQELTREANTLGSKAGDLELTRVALDLKSAIDQLKEQAANVE
jgi:uncharacterized protein (TIGR00255 family)